MLFSGFDELALPCIAALIFSVAVPTLSWIIASVIKADFSLALSWLTVIKSLSNASRLAIPNLVF